MADSSGAHEAGPRLAPEEYTVGWICATPIELGAAIAMFDLIHQPVATQAEDDDNLYHLGSIGNHNVVISCLPCNGIVEAAVTVNSMQRTFTGLKFGLLVGIGRGIPSPEHDIRLGDVVVSRPSGQAGGVIQHDLGKKVIGGFDRVGFMNSPSNLLLNAVNNLEVRSDLGKELANIVDEAAENGGYPGHEKDVLFAAAFEHIGKSPNCAACLKENAGLVQRAPRKNNNSRNFHGNIASGNSVIMDAVERDRIGAKEGVICFDTTAAGVMNQFKCLVVRGISNYADSHSNRSWQRYSAAVAAAYAKTLLCVIPRFAGENLDNMNRIHHQVVPIFTGQTALLGSSHHKPRLESRESETKEKRFSL